MLVVASLANTKLCKEAEYWLKPWQMGTHLRELGKGYLMNIKMTLLRWFSENLRKFCPSPLDKISLSIGSVNPYAAGG